MQKTLNTAIFFKLLNCVYTVSVMSAMNSSLIVLGELYRVIHDLRPPCGAHPVNVGSKVSN